MSDCHLEVVQPLISIQEGIERNLNEIPETTKSIARKLNKIDRKLKEKEETIAEEELKEIPKKIRAVRLAPVREREQFIDSSRSERKEETITKEELKEIPRKIRSVLIGIR
jgi:hypothetical protein